MYKEIVKYLSTPTIVIDNAKKILYVNDSLCKLMNVNNDAWLMGRPIHDMFPELVYNLDINSLPCGHFLTKEVTINQKKMEANYINIVDHKNNLILIELKNQEENSVEGGLVKANEFQAIIDASYDGLYITNRFGTTIFVNKSYEKITGIKKEELLGKNISDLEKSGMFSPIITPTIIEKKTPITCHQILRNGKKVVITGNPVFDNNGDVAYIVTNVRDITEIEDLRMAFFKQKELNYEYMQRLHKIKEEKELQENFIARSKSMQYVLNFASKVAKVKTTVLITGETGVGKEVLANYIYKLSDRNNKPFLAINCGAVVPTLLESELFGYVKGAFTGALNKDKPGLFEAADKGTIFLDEIGDMPLELQVKLLRVLQEGEVKRVGSTETIKVDVRLICATNKNLEELVAQGKFREDLFYRLNVVAIEVPPLRKRKEDIPYLAHHFCNYFNAKYMMKKRLTTELIDAFLEYHWPGNIRELKNLIEQMVILSSEDEIGIKSLPNKMQKYKNINTNNIKQIKKIIMIQNNYNINISKHMPNLGTLEQTLQYIDCFEQDSSNIEQYIIRCFDESRDRKNVTVFLHHIHIRMLEIFPRLIQRYQTSNCELICSANSEVIREIQQNDKFSNLGEYFTVVNLPNGIILTNKSDNAEELINYYFDYYCNKYNTRCSISAEAKKCLVSYKWKDEEEIKQLLEQLILKNCPKIEIYHLPKEVYDVSFMSDQPIRINQIIPMKDAVEKIEKQLIEMAVRKHGSKRKAAIELGMDPSSIGRKIVKYNIDLSKENQTSVLNKNVSKYHDRL
ncbi:MAG: sigma 54-interacting transcriptional regulator [Tepidanaerobacteraceae bacterium]|jgi:PAS domain S-box-containing protein|nr:sigma 54-interacting transcriptional regulator [Tepidanaerobacteraceae bacterium]